MIYVVAAQKTRQQVKKISADNATNQAEINAFVNNKTGAGSRDRGRVGLDRRDGGSNQIRCRYCGTTHQRRKELCPAFGSRCNKVRQRKPFCESLHAKRENPAKEISTGCIRKWIYRFRWPELVPSKNDTIMAVQDPDSYQPRLFTTMKIKGEETSKFQIDTGATCSTSSEKRIKRYQV